MAPDFVSNQQLVKLWKDEGDENIGRIEWTSVRPQDLREMTLHGKWDIDFIGIQGNASILLNNDHVLSFIVGSQARILQTCILRPVRLSNCGRGLILAYFS